MFVDLQSENFFIAPSELTHDLVLLLLVLERKDVPKRGLLALKQLVYLLFHFKPLFGVVTVQHVDHLRVPLLN